MKILSVIYPLVIERFFFPWDSKIVLDHVLTNWFFFEGSALWTWASLFITNKKVPANPALPSENIAELFTYGKLKLCLQLKFSTKSLRIPFKRHLSNILSFFWILETSLNKKLLLFSKTIQQKFTSVKCIVNSTYLKRKYNLCWLFRVGKFRSTYQISTNTKNKNK